MKAEKPWTFKVYNRVSLSNSHQLYAQNSYLHAQHLVLINPDPMKTFFTAV